MPTLQPLSAAAAWLRRPLIPLGAFCKITSFVAHQLSHHALPIHVKFQVLSCNCWGPRNRAWVGQQRRSGRGAPRAPSGT